LQNFTVWHDPKGGGNLVNVASVNFLKSAAQPKDYPPDNLPEIAFAGRSNVGKSSLINSLCHVRGVAKTSRTPGKTQLINFFLLNDSFRFVDLPGYGYARVAQLTRASWQQMVEDYFRTRKTLKAVVLLIDCRRGPEEEEIQLLEYLEHHHTATEIVLTKADKLNQSERKRLEQHLIREVGLDPERFAFVSSTKNQGIADLWRRLVVRLSE
jgi:GTP-binding protein